ncbi:hypothetical protein KOW79_014484 [Hemibagrus wyckioides]|uniref:NEDD4-binding protein 2-like 2 n=1 Tax=Hemibagrus wyckioides TaxID=337641 RepID=A0A9D3NDX7_9TELE|nr:NEDD4-binding protein 2-like 2 [Hemibagrus wyckioides]KAG7321626.1 hypothetical protein KOW79_014484 [Hemibagrus wyckioides]
MPNVTPAGSSPPPVSGSVGDPQQLHPAETVSYSRALLEDTPDPGLPEGLSVEANRCPEQLNTGEEKTSGDDERACNQLKNREEVIKEISISSKAFIGPACRPQPQLEDELSEFYKELKQIQQPDTVTGNNGSLSQPGPPSDTVDGNRQRVSHSWPPSDSEDGNSHYVSDSWPPSDTVVGNNENVSRSWAPPTNSPAIKEKGNNHRNTYRPYPATRPQTDYRNTPQWRPQPHDTTYNWSNPHSFQNQWQLPPPNIHFYPPPRPGNPPHPPYSQHHGHWCSQPAEPSFQFSPDVRLASSHGPASYAPYEGFERPQYEEQDSQDVNQHTCNDEPVLILMRGVPGSGKSTLARQISSRGPSGLILSTDDFFYRKNGYHFDPALLGDAHDWNHNRAKQAMLKRHTPVIIDNTNVQAWEMKPYITVALEMGYRVEFVEPDTGWKCDPVELEKRNHHGVSRETIANMLDRFEVPISVDIVMTSCEPSHKRKKHRPRHYRHRR